MNPQARTKGLVVRDLSGELVVYDLDRHQAHCLNKTAAVVFRHADGRRNRTDLAGLLGDSGRAGVGAVDLALEQLDEAKLLESSLSAETRQPLPRRDALRRAAIGAAILLPFVTSVLAPAPAEAAATCVTSCSGEADTTPCTCFGADPCTSTCLSGVCQPDNIC